MNVITDIELNPRGKAQKKVSLALPKSLRKKMNSSEENVERVLTPWGAINVPNDDEVYLKIKNKSRKSKKEYIDQKNSDFHKVKEEIVLPIRL